MGFIVTALWASRARGHADGAFTPVQLGVIGGIFGAALLLVFFGVDQTEWLGL